MAKKLINQAKDFTSDEKMKFEEYLRENLSDKGYTIEGSQYSPTDVYDPEDNLLTVWIHNTRDWFLEESYNSKKPESSFAHFYGDSSTFIGIDILEDLIINYLSKLEE